MLGSFTYLLYSLNAISYTSQVVRSPGGVRAYGRRSTRRRVQIKFLREPRRSSEYDRLVSTMMPSREWELVTLLSLEGAGAAATSSPSSSTSSLLKGDLSPPFHSPVAKHYLGQIARASAAPSTSTSAIFPSQLQAPSDVSTASLDAIELAAASLSAFIQLNWTGPEIPPDLELNTLLRWADVSAFPPRQVDTKEEDDGDKELERRLNDAAIEALTCEGEPAYHLCKHPWFLVLALRVLESIYAAPAQQHPESLAWWRLRAANIHNRVLDTPVSVGKELLSSVDALLEKLATRATADPSSWSLLHARLLLERGLILSRVGQDKEANEFFLRAAQASRLRYELSGALGKRTKFQKEEKTILVVLAESSPEACKEMQGHGVESSNTQEAASGGQDAQEAEDEVAGLPSHADKGGWTPTPAAGQRGDMPSEYALNDDTLLEQTKFTATAASDALSHRDPSNQPALAPLDQSILLSLSLFIRNTSPEHGLTTSQISAFVSRVAMHPRNWSVFTMALLLRSRLEASRSRTAQRAALQLQALLDQMPTTDSTPQERLRYFYQLDLPPKWEMQAELARRYAALGVLRSALEIFQSIELWEEVVQCLGMLGRQEEGVEVIRDLLEGRKTEAEAVLAIRKNQPNSSAAAAVPQRYTAARQAKLWCLLGDLEPAQAEVHYTKAWEVSGHRSARAARSLGGLYFAKAQTDAEYGVVVQWLRRAVKLSSLMTRTWFMLGCTYMRREEWGKAARSFRRCAAIDEEDGEAWNNLASCYLRMVDGATVEDIEDDDSDADVDVGGDDESDGGRTIGSDSGVELSSGESEAEADGDDDAADGEARTATRREKLSPFVLKTLAHRCLKHSIKYAPDSWRVWSNYMIVSVDVGQMGEACRALAQVVRFRSRSSGGRLKEDDIDWQVVDRLVDAVIRAPGQTVEEEQQDREAGKEEQQETPASDMTYEQATAVAVAVPISSTAQSNTGTARSTNEGRGLYPSVTALICDTLLPTLSHLRLHRAHARLLLWSKDYSSALEAHLAAYRASIAGDAAFVDQVSSDATKWKEAVEEVKETIDSIETLGFRMDQEKETKFKARSLLRTFMARFKVWEDTKEWEELLALREELK